MAETAVVPVIPPLRVLQQLLLCDARTGADGRRRHHCAIGANRYVRNTPGEGGPEGEEDDGVRDEQVERTQDGRDDHSARRRPLFVLLDHPPDPLQWAQLRNAGLVARTSWSRLSRRVTPPPERRLARRVAQRRGRGGGRVVGAQHPQAIRAEPLQLPVPFVQKTGPPYQNHRLADLPDYQEKEGQNDGVGQCLVPKSPFPEERMPVHDVDQNRRHQRPGGIPGHDEAAEERHGRISILFVPQVNDDAAGDDAEGGGAHACEEARHQKACHIAHDGAERLGNNEDDGCGSENGESAPDLRDGRQDHGRQAEAEAKRGNANEHDDVRRAELLRQ
ncbi:hypothetical protein XA68_12526 [Ophiocordyceps unilateralis]|uniref:Uncharacterized protein n=1 Tax=Ophiocordyceps unilateralis TaxID=268505 RepID=A0A2A9PMC8_OPHUN|nr:hypothetical protein XA68_12526 [Ophiocordyceps unilateralis]